MLLKLAQWGHVIFFSGWFLPRGTRAYNIAKNNFVWHNPGDSHSPLHKQPSKKFCWNFNSEAGGGRSATCKNNPISFKFAAFDLIFMFLSTSYQKNDKQVHLFHLLNYFIGFLYSRFTLNHLTFSSLFSGKPFQASNHFHDLILWPLLLHSFFAGVQFT